MPSLFPYKDDLKIGIDECVCGGRENKFKNI